LIAFKYILAVITVFTVLLTAIFWLDFFGASSAFWANNVIAGLHLTGLIVAIFGSLICVTPAYRNIGKWYWGMLAVTLLISLFVPVVFD
jgi:hypothetical protein